MKPITWSCGTIRLTTRVVGLADLVLRLESVYLDSDYRPMERRLRHYHEVVVTSVQAQRVTTFRELFECAFNEVTTSGFEGFEDVLDMLDLKGFAWASEVVWWGLIERGHSGDGLNRVRSMDELETYLRDIFDLESDTLKAFRSAVVALQEDRNPEGLALLNRAIDRAERDWRAQEKREEP